jgi:hypothetical protein
LIACTTLKWVGNLAEINACSARGKAFFADFLPLYFSKAG